MISPQSQPPRPTPLTGTTATAATSRGIYDAASGSSAGPSSPTSPRHYDKFTYAWRRDASAIPADTPGGVPGALSRNPATAQTDRPNARTPVTPIWKSHASLSSSSAAAASASSSRAARGGGAMAMAAPSASSSFRQAISPHTGTTSTRGTATKHTHHQYHQQNSRRPPPLAAAAEERGAGVPPHRSVVDPLPRMVVPGGPGAADAPTGLPPPPPVTYSIGEDGVIHSRVLAPARVAYGPVLVEARIAPRGLASAADVAGQPLCGQNIWLEIGRILLSSHATASSLATGGADDRAATLAVVQAEWPLVAAVMDDILLSPPFHDTGVVGAVPHVSPALARAKVEALWKRARRLRVPRVLERTVRAAVDDVAAALAHRDAAEVAEAATTTRLDWRRPIFHEELRWDGVARVASYNQ